MLVKCVREIGCISEYNINLYIVVYYIVNTLFCAFFSFIKNEKNKDNIGK